MSSLKPHYDNLTKPDKMKDDGTTTTIFLTDDGTTSGSKDMAINASGAPVDFWIQPPPGFAVRINLLNVMISDTGIPAYDGYGNISNGVISNGVQLFFETGGVRTLIEDPFVENNEYVIRSQQLNIEDFAANVRIITYRDLLTNYSSGFEVKEADGDKFGVVINDDFSSLTLHEFIIKGLIYRSNF